MKNIRIALAQINPIVGDLLGNTAKIIKNIKNANSLGVELIAFPELAVTGYPPEDLLLKPYFVDKNRDCLNEIKKHCGNITAIVGFADTSRGNVFNAAGILHNKSLIYTYHKIHLPNYGVFDERRYFAEGTECVILKEGGIKWSVNICEDMWIEPGPVLHQAETGGARLIINISASPYHRGKHYERERLLKSQAKKHKAIIAYCNMLGGQDELVFDGGSAIVNSDGKLLALGKQFEEDLIVADIELEKSRHRHLKKMKNIKIKHIDLKFHKLAKKPKIKTHIMKPLPPIEETYSALTLGLRDYVHKNKFKKVILGLSGGIDSTLTALIAMDALGKQNVIALSMPSPYTSKGTMSDKYELAKRLGIKILTIPITNIYNKYLGELKPHFHNKSWDITEENIQARIRGNLLMALSNKFGYLVLTTGNKSETSVGYCTLYGDMAGGFAVIKDVPKELVYALTKYRNNKSQNKLVPKTIFSRPPTAELRDGQKDEDSLPPYPVLDKIIDLYVEQNKSYKEISRNKFSKDTIKKVLHLIDFNEYKRRQAPPGIKITPKSYGKDRRMPITNRAPL